MSIVKRALPEKLLIETQDLKLKMYSNPDLMCQGGTDEENEEHFYLKETEKIQQQLMKDLNYGTGYLYSHDYPNSFIAQEFLPEEIKGTSFIEASDNKKEQEIKANIIKNWKEKYK